MRWKRDASKTNDCPATACLSRLSSSPAIHLPACLLKNVHESPMFISISIIDYNRNLQLTTAWIRQAWLESSLVDYTGLTRSHTQPLLVFSCFWHTCAPLHQQQQQKPRQQTAAFSATHKRDGWCPNNWRTVNNEKRKKGLCWGNNHNWKSCHQVWRDVYRGRKYFNLNVMTSWC